MFKTKKNKKKYGGAKKKTRKERRNEYFDVDFTLDMLEQQIENQNEVHELIQLFKRNSNSPRHDIYLQRNAESLNRLNELEKEKKRIVKSLKYRAGRIHEMEN